MVSSPFYHFPDGCGKCKVPSANLSHPGKSWKSQENHQSGFEDHYNMGKGAVSHLELLRVGSF